VQCARKRASIAPYALGNPVKQVRRLSEGELVHFKYSAEHYMRLAAKHRASL
jgi:carbonic anhydrase/acetyltransferase-like protein (isoleucine patch superfamily)